MRKPKKMDPISPSDQAFFNDFYSKYSKFMFYTARKHTTSKAECEDIVQETVVRLIGNISTLRDMSDYRCVKYIALSVKSAFLDIEKLKRQDFAVPMDDEMLEALMKADILSPKDMPDLTAKTNIALLKKELSPRDWIVLEGKYILGYSQEELGQMIGVSPDSIRMILSRAKKKARMILRPDIEGGEKNE